MTNDNKKFVCLFAGVLTAGLGFSCFIEELDLKPKSTYEL